MAQIPRIAICDDDKTIHHQIISLIQDYQLCHEMPNVTFCKFFSDEELIANQLPLDLLFLDIELGHKTGVELVPIMKQRFPGITIIFISSHTKYFIHTTRLGIFQFLTKPFDKVIFFEELDRFFYRHLQQQMLYQIKWKGTVIQFPIVEILYIASMVHQVLIYRGTEIYKKRGQLAVEEKKLQLFDFIRCHQSFLVNARYIKEINKNTFLLSNTHTNMELQIPISKNRAVQAKAHYYNWLMKQEYSNGKNIIKCFIC